jgi:hypothetical protein
MRIPEQVSLLPTQRPPLSKGLPLKNVLGEIIHEHWIAIVWHVVTGNRGTRIRRVKAYKRGAGTQSHFYKEYRIFTGTSPATLLASMASASTAVTHRLLEGDLAAA